MAQMTALSWFCLDESFTIRMPIEDEKMPEGGLLRAGKGYSSVRALSR